MMEELKVIEEQFFPKNMRRNFFGEDKKF